jgi:hypothetical protein
MKVVIGFDSRLLNSVHCFLQNISDHQQPTSLYKTNNLTIEENKRWFAFCILLWFALVLAGLLACFTKCRCNHRCWGNGLLPTPFAVVFSSV